MIRITHLDHVNFRVRDLEESIGFYERLFGFEIKQQGVCEGQPWAIVGEAGAAYLCLYQLPEGELSDQGLRINHFGFHVEDFDQLKEKLQAENVEIMYEGAAIDWEHSRSFYIKDPSGHEIELSEHFGGALN